MAEYHYHPIQCIVPPHMVERILKNGSSKQIEWATDNLNVSGQLRGQRQSLAEVSAKPKAAIGNKMRNIYDAKFGSTLPGKLVRGEGDAPTNDKAANEAYDGAGATYDLYDQVFGRNSIDDNGLPLISSVHYLKGYDNAFWNGSQMVYGDGDEDLPNNERLFNRFTIAVDIIGHELTHGVTQYEANLVYRNQSGALNESFSDVFGSLVKQKLNNQEVSQADWIIGEGLFTSNVNGRGIRDMKNPGTAYDDTVLGKDPQPGHMNDYVNMTSDNGGVHINSGIPNRAFYEVARLIGGYAWEKTGKIWYVTLRDKLNQTSGFQAAANLTYETAGELFGANGTEQNAVKTGWSLVGIIVNQDKKTGCGKIFANIMGRNNSF
ncbi:MAG TPA: M4 family metallopeptidase [Sunxiuqinia sp.]|nr:M4 family metallopeptidase [Sunxiuqinia sp.]